MSRRDSDSEKVPAALYDRLTDTPTYAARMYKVQAIAMDELSPVSVNIRSLNEKENPGWSIMLCFCNMEAYLCCSPRSSRG